MPAVKLQKFLGAAPKIAPELLPDTAAQVATNVKLYSGDLLPYRYPLLAGTCGQSGTIKTIYPMRDPDVPTSYHWLSWLTDTDVATSTALDGDEQRIYYTDGVNAPRVTNYELAVDGTPPYPTDWYDLGLPLPTSVPTATATSYSTKTISTYARDAGNIATIVTSSNHALKSGAVVTITGFNDSASTESFNIQNTTVTVVDDTTLKYYSTGDVLSTASADTDGRLRLAGGTVLRQYVYTWMTPWMEESIPSEPTDAIYIKEGQVVSVTGLPTAKPSGDNFIRGFRLYRTVTSDSSSAYLRLRTVWFPVTLASASRSSNVATITLTHPHNLQVGDLIKTVSVAFGGIADTSFNETDEPVITVVDDYTFTYASSGSDKATTATSAGTLQYDVSEPGSTTGTYYSGSTFTDNYDVNGLIFQLDSLDHDAPDSGMVGIIAAHNNILVGFVGNEVCFSEPDKPWAWPLATRKVFPNAVVAVASMSGYILVLTEKYPYIIEGNTPRDMQYSRVDTPYVCTSKRGVVVLPTGVVYPTHGGLATFGVNGISLTTANIQDWDTWADFTDPTDLNAEFYNGKYFASDGARSFIFEENAETGGTYVTINSGFMAAHYDALYGKFYCTLDTTGEIYEWDSATNPLAPMEWRSKVINTQEYINIGAARVIADYDVDSGAAATIAAYNANVVAHNTALWPLIDQLGSLNHGLNYTDPDTTSVVAVSGALNTTLVNGDPLTQYQLTGYSVYPLSFRLWVEGILIFETELTDSEIFRLPSGYRSDTFEVGISGVARVKAVHIGETPFGLRTA